MELTVNIKFKNGGGEEINPLISITPCEDGFEIYNGSYYYKYLIDKIESIKIEKLS